MQPHKILIVDDNRFVADSVAILLRLTGHEALTAYDGGAALAAVEAFHPDVVLVDLVMPGIDGFEIARQLRASHNGTMRIIALSAFGMPEVREATRAAGFDALLTKPATADELAGILDG
jgi:CheY-like chemotaxis protein